MIRRHKRWVLLLSSLMAFGSTYCYDNPSALKSQLQQRFHDLPKSQYEFLFSLSYSLYSMPNMVLPFFGGMLVDKFGVRSVALVLSTLLLLGQLVVALGCTFKNFYLILAGRILFGFGGETMWVAQSSFVTLWFESSELAFAFGINTLFARLGTVINDKLSPLIADEYSVSSALWFGTFVCVFSLFCTWVLVQIDARAEVVAESMKVHKEIEAPANVRDIFRFSKSFWLIAVKYVSLYACIGPFNNVASSILIERDFFKTPPAPCVRCGIGAYKELDCTFIPNECPPSPPFAWPLPLLNRNCSITLPSDQFHCSKAPPYISEEEINCDDIAWRDGPFTSTYCGRKSKALEHATTTMSITPLIIAFVAPISGSVIDAVGLRPLFALLAECLLVTSHFCLSFTSIPAQLALALIGFSACIFSSSMWPCIPYVVEPRYVGTAFGAITSFSNCGLAAVPLIVASVYNSHGNYIPSVEYVFISCALLTIVFGILLNIVDVSRGHVLNRRVLYPLQSSHLTQSLLRDEDSTCDESQDYIE